MLKRHPKHPYALVAQCLYCPRCLSPLVNDTGLNDPTIALEPEIFTCLRCGAIVKGRRFQVCDA